MSPRSNRNSRAGPWIIAVVSTFLGIAVFNALGSSGSIASGPDPTAGSLVTFGGAAASLLGALGVLSIFRWRRARADAADYEESLHRLILESVSDAIVVWRPGGEIIFFSRSAERMFGRSRSEVIGRPLKLLVAPKLQRGIDRVLGRDPDDDSDDDPDHDSDQDDAPCTSRLIPLRCLRADGSVFPAELVWSRHDPADAERLELGVIRDLSDRKGALEARRRSEALRRIIDGLPDAVVVQREERLVYANRAFLERLDYVDPAQVVDRSIRQFLHADDLERMFGRLHEIEQTGKPAPPAEERFLKRDGAAVLLEVARLPIQFDGEPACLVIAREPNDRKWADERFRLAVESAPSGMVMVDREGRIMLVNREITRMFGYSESEILGRSIEVLVPERDRDMHPEQRERFASAPRARQMGSGRKLHGLHRDGSEIPLEIGLNPIQTREGLMVLASVVDISARQKSDLLHAAIDRMSVVGTLAAGVAHEINNPLAFVKGNIQFARSELDAKVRGTGLADSLGETFEALEQAEEGADRIRDIVSDLHTFAKEDRTHTGRVDLHRVLESVVTLTWNEIRHHAMLTREFGPIPDVVGDESRLAHAFTNLILNATQALPEDDAANQRIRLVTRVGEPGEVVVEIHDTGAGVPEELRRHIFYPFFTTKPVGEGAGLGLAVTHGIIESLGGRIEVDSGRGGGAVFRVILPAASAGCDAESAKTPPRIEGRVPKILIVDDDTRILAMMRRMLADRADVDTSGDAREALTRLTSGVVYDAILCDLMMPGMTGIQLYESLKWKHPRLTSRFIFVTGGAFTPRAQQFVEVVPNRVLIKPVDRDELMEVVEAVMAAAGGPDETR